MPCKDCENYKPKKDRFERELDTLTFEKDAHSALIKKDGKIIVGFYRDGELIVWTKLSNARKYTGTWFK